MTIDRYRTDIEKLVRSGKLLILTMALEIKANVKTDLSEDEIKKLPSFKSAYQKWYSESLACIRQLLPVRVGDFTAFYSPPKSRKDITYENYTISAYLK